jgi:23S rRNA pseudouridine1911/1915/1917 synthase
MNAPPDELRACSVQIGPELAGQTLAAVVRAQYTSLALSWNRARELCKRGKVKLNDALETDDARRVQLGDRVAIEPSGRRVRAHVLDDAAIVYLDAQVVVVNKPAGLLSVPFEAGDKDTLSDQLRAWLRRNASAHGTEVGAVQRLDKDTTGVLVFARTLAAKRHLQQQLRVHSVERRYRALVHGAITQEHTFDTHLIRNRGDGLRGSFGHFRKPKNPMPADAQRAVTDVAPLEALRGATLIECRLHTGRQHQIRIHLSEFGHPLIGETVYIRDFPGAPIEAPRPMLHAAVLGFVHPRTEEPLRFEQPPPADFAEAHARLAAR